MDLNFPLKQRGHCQHFVANKQNQQHIFTRVHLEAAEAVAATVAEAGGATTGATGAVTGGANGAATEGATGVETGATTGTGMESSEVMLGATLETSVVAQQLH